MSQDYAVLTQLASEDIPALKQELERRFVEMYGASSEAIKFFAGRIGYKLEDITVF